MKAKFQTPNSKRQTMGEKSKNLILQIWFPGFCLVFGVCDLEFSTEVSP
jgi:hypothetical protein